MNISSASFLPPAEDPVTPASSTSVTRLQRRSFAPLLATQEPRRAEHHQLNMLLHKNPDWPSIMNSYLSFDTSNRKSPGRPSIMNVSQSPDRRTSCSRHQKKPASAASALLLSTQGHRLAKHHEHQPISAYISLSRPSSEKKVALRLAARSRTLIHRASSVARTSQAATRPLSRIVCHHNCAY